jgi:TPR repeat protein
LTSRTGSAPAESRLRAGLLAAFGALALTIVAIVGSLGFLWWRSNEQLRVLDVRKGRCAGGDASACDLLRNACLKRSADGCAALGNALLATGPRHDATEGLRLLGEACTYRQRDACLRAGTLLTTGTDVPKDEAAGRRLLDRACLMGLKDACSK